MNDPFKVGRLSRPSLAFVKRWLGYRALHKKFSGHTMIKWPYYWRNLELVWQWRDVPGPVVECGVWRGGMSASIASLLGGKREHYLFDSFEGLPAPTEADGLAAKKWSEDKQSEDYYDNCRAEIGAAQEAMRLAGVSNARFIQGWFHETLPDFHISEPIGILRLDGDWYDSTICCLEHLFPKVRPGGLIIIDDYAIWDGCTRAVHDYLSKHQRTEAIRQFADLVSYIRKV